MSLPPSEGIQAKENLLGRWARLSFCTLGGEAQAGVRLDLELPLLDSQSRERPGLTVVTLQCPEQPLGSAVEQVSPGADLRQACWSSFTFARLQQCKASF